MLDINLIDGYSHEKKSLKECSKDDHHNSVTDYLVSFEFKVIPFEHGLREIYLKKRIEAVSQEYQYLAVCDSLHIHNDHIYLIEFKNGKVDNREIKRQVNSSLLILLDILQTNIHCLKQSISFILVYNEDKNKTEKTKGSIMATGLYKKTYPVRFDLKPYEELYFKDVHTLTADQFEKVFVSEWDT